MKKLEDLVVMEGYMIDYWREKLKVGNSTVFFFFFFGLFLSLVYLGIFEVSEK